MTQRIEATISAVYTPAIHGSANQAELRRRYVWPFIEDGGSVDILSERLQLESASEGESDSWRYTRRLRKVIG